jgi:hypothetical protein
VLGNSPPVLVLARYAGYAIISGAEKYSSFSPTEFAQADCDRIYNTLTQYCDYAEKHILCLKLSPESDEKPLDILGLEAAMLSKPTVRPTVRERLSRKCAFSGKYTLATTGMGRICPSLPLASHPTFLGKSLITSLYVTER